MVSSVVGGSMPGSLYYGYLPSTEMYWAMATYDGVRTDPLAVQVSFQDGGAMGMFKEVGSGPWQA
jgi:hypothetical protein